MRLYCIILFSLTNIICFGQNRQVELEIIGGKIYNELYIRSKQLNNKVVTFAGEAVSDSLWIFTIPDSVVNKTTDFYLSNKSQQGKGNKIVFLGIIQSDTLISQEIHFENDERLIRLKMEYHHTAHEVNYQYIPELKKSFAVQEWDSDFFIVDPNQNLFLQKSMTDRFFPFFNSAKDYDETLSEHASKILANPNSLYYMTRLVGRPEFFRSKEDIAFLYYLFSDEMQRSYFGQIVYAQFSTFKIENVSLMNCVTKMEEMIVTNTNKHTLLIFSASWCLPCHKKIPMLKKIYEEKNMMLDMVYITIDEEKLLPQWKKLMLKENIPWRSLSLNNKELQNIWNIKAIPDFILIDQNLNALKINLNDEKDVDNLYSTIQKK